MNDAFTDPSVRLAAEAIHAHLAEVDPLPAKSVDAILGFGMFDLSLPRFCADLYQRGLAVQIVFTGGIGAGTGDLGGPEAEVWLREVRRSHPDIPPTAIITESRSTNTAENIEFTTDLLARDHPTLAFGKGIHTAIIVASPSRLRRVGLSMRHRLPSVRTMRLLPAVSFDTEAALYQRQGINYLEHLIGEVDRLETYPARGWIAYEPIPEGILAARATVRSALR